MKLELGLCKGRHNIPVTDYIFDTEVDPIKVDELYKCARKKLEELFPVREPIYITTSVDSDDVRFYYAGELKLYVTGLSVALIAVLNACYCIGIKVTLMHYDRENNCYYEQKVIGLF